MMLDLKSKSEPLQHYVEPKKPFKVKSNVSHRSHMCRRVLLRSNQPQTTLPATSLNQTQVSKVKSTTSLFLPRSRTPPVSLKQSISSHSICHFVSFCKTQFLVVPLPLSLLLLPFAFYLSQPMSPVNSIKFGTSSIRFKELHRHVVRCCM